MLTQEVRSALVRELGRLRGQQAKLNEKIGALEKVVSPDDGLGLFPTSSASPPLKNDSKSGVVYNGTLNGGPRQVIRKLLEKHPDGLRPCEVSKWLKGEGYRLNGKTELSARIAGEMSRMKREKILDKRGKKYLLFRPFG